MTAVPDLLTWFLCATSDDASDRKTHTSLAALRHRRDTPTAIAPASLDPASQAIVERIHEGDLATFETLFRQWFTPLVNFAMAYVHAQDTAQDTAQDVVFDVLTRIWLHRDTWSPQHGIAAYLFGAVRNRALNAKRDARTRAHHADQYAARYAASGESVGMSVPPPRPDTAVEIEEQQRRVWTAIGTLTPARRAVLTLRWQHQMTWDDIASTLGLNVEMVRKHHTRGIADLKKILS